MKLVDHAARELEIIGEDAETKAGLLRVVQAFADMGHSGASAHFCANALDALLRYKPLAPLTNDPAEWIDRTEISGGHPMWQSARNSEAFSSDGGRTYYLLSEVETVGDGVRPIHTAADPRP